MINFQSTIFNRFFTSYEKTSDTNKDVNDKGTLERFNELIGQDIDNELVPFIDQLVKNIVDPKTNLQQYIPYTEAQLGVDVIVENSLVMRRRVMKIIIDLYKIKGTQLCYEILFNMMGLSVTITEFFGDWGFDSPLTFDDPVRRFDSACPACSDYQIDLTGSFISLSAGQVAALFSIITFNQPINARVRNITYNGLGISGDFSLFDFNNDYFV